MLTLSENGLLYLDENGNTWSAKKFSFEEAQKAAASLVNCSYCSDCSDCSHCSHCSDCLRCLSCSYCSDCSGCSYCSDCSDYIKNPERIISPILGSREEAQTTVYRGYTPEGASIQVICGCFRGNLEAFEAAVTARHGGNEYGAQYIAFINKVRAYFEI